VFQSGRSKALTAFDHSVTSRLVVLSSHLSDAEAIVSMAAPTKHGCKTRSAQLVNGPLLNNPARLHSLRFYWLRVDSGL
jgi:hypothetical protein